MHFLTLELFLNIFTDKKKEKEKKKSKKKEIFDPFKKHYRVFIKKNEINLKYKWNASSQAILSIAFPNSTSLFCLIGIMFFEPKEKKKRQKNEKNEEKKKTSFLKK